ncbi:MAG: acyl carrier protein phosphodiesterase [Bacteroidia bacterium]
MNFLAHLYLSGNNEPVMIGNFIADHLKGKQWMALPEEIQKGVVLHRFIDSFTDSHPVVEQSKALLRPFFHKYTPVVSDIFYDHFLAAEWNNYSDIPIDEYARDVYQLMHKNYHFLPARTKEMLVYMENDNWLKNYATLNGINRALSGMGRRAKFDNNMHQAAEFLYDNYEAFKNQFEVFFPELEQAVKQK